MLNQTIPCRFCGNPAQFIDRYLSPFQEDQTTFPESMAIYWCPEQSIGFANPVPSAMDLEKYYKEIYRASRRMCGEDPHQHYATLKSTPLTDSQFMYLSQFINFDEIQTVIDMGCGHGMLLRRIHLYNPRIKLIGIDLDPAVGPFLKEIGSEFIHASASASVDAICERLTDDTLLISSHTLHYQHDLKFLQDIISRAKALRGNNIFLFIEVPNDNIDNSEYVPQRVYDVPKLILFTSNSFRRRNIFDLSLLNVTTNGWTIEEELAFRRYRVEQYRSGMRHSMKGLARTIAKAIVPRQTRRFIKTILTGLRGSNHDLDYYFSYGGDRRAIRMIGKIR